MYKNTWSCSLFKLGRKLTYPNTERLFPEFTNPFCFSPSSQLDFEHPIQMMVSVLPKQLEKAGSCSQNVGACGRLPNQSQVIQQQQCDNNLSQSRGNQRTAAIRPSGSNYTTQFYLCVTSATSPSSTYLILYVSPLPMVHLL